MAELPLLLYLLLLPGIPYSDLIFYTRTELKTKKKSSPLPCLKHKQGKEALIGLFSDISIYLSNVSENVTNTLKALSDEDRTMLKEERKASRKIKKHVNVIIAHIINSVKLLKDDEVKQGLRYGKIIASIKEIHTYTKDMSTLSYEHIDNNHGRTE